MTGGGAPGMTGGTTGPGAIGGGPGIPGATGGPGAGGTAGGGAGGAGGPCWGCWSPPVFCCSSAMVALRCYYCPGVLKPPPATGCCDPRPEAICSTLKLTFIPARWRIPAS